ncbi:hypothetical protein N0V90_013082 [Kalmusia sp. IMI 367209]|nr:hypothetical protein N0V90_013082 [Kalmusia sp. IMI 367209]
MSSISAYGPLSTGKKEIRVLYINDFVPGSPHGYEEQCLTGKLTHFRLDEEHKPYYALSYVWGDPTPVSAIILDIGARIPIAQNLLVALQHLRRNDFLPIGVPIWVDAACINQHDDTEKSSQVTQMASIYSMAEKTLIFLGTASEGSNQTMNFLDAVGERVIKSSGGEYLEWERRTDKLYENAIVFHGVSKSSGFKGTLRILRERYRRHSAYHQIKHVFRSVSKKELQNISTAHLRTMMEQQWWSRVWVLQELILSHSPWFVWGDEIVAAERVAATCQFLDSIGLYFAELRQLKIRIPKLSGFVDVLCEMDPYLFDAPAMRLYHEKKNGLLYWWSLGSVVTYIRTYGRLLQTSEPVDQIYGVLGLVKHWPASRSPILPDYSMDYIEVSARVTVTILETTATRIKSILRMSTFPKAVASLPSWVPDWSLEWDDDNYGEINTYNEIRQTLSYQMVDNGQHLLTITGRVYGSIQMLDTPLNALRRYKTIPFHSFDHDSISKDFTDCLHALHDSIWKQVQTTSPPTWLIRDECITIALLLVSRLRKFAYMEHLTYRDENRAENAYHIRASKEILQFSDAMLSILESSNNKEFQGKPSKIPSILLDSLYFTINEARLENTIIRTDNNYLGVTRDTVQAGDLIVRFDIDDCVHFIVRPVEDGKYRLISMAWMHQLMREPSIKGQHEEFTLC